MADAVSDGVRIDKLSQVGRYALGVQWGDGHDSILPHRNIRRACPCEECESAAPEATADTAPFLNVPLSTRKDHVFGVGAEGSVFIPQAKLLLGLRVVPEFGAVNRTQDVTWVLTIGYQAKSLVKAPPAK